MKKTKRIICLAVIYTFILQPGWGKVSAAVYPQQPAPTKMRVEAMHNSPPNDVQPAIGYNEFDGYYADLRMDPVKIPTPPPSVSNIYVNYYLQEINKAYKPVKPVIQKGDSIAADTVQDNVLRMKELSSGTVYYAFSRAYYTYSDGTVSYTSTESSSSNAAKFMTDIAIQAQSYGPNQIKIVWDDVWNSGKRIDYKLYISDNKDFTNTPPIYIGQGQIGQNGPVTVNEAEGKLEYIYTVRDPGRVYYVKIAPDITEAGLYMSPESQTVTVSSYILAKTTKMSVTDFGTIWKLEWSPVVTGIGDSSVNITYQIYKGTGDGGSIEQYMASVDDTVFFLTVQPDDVSSYYIIKAQITKDGEDVYPGIKIQSEKIYVKESEVPSTPAAPEIVDEFQNAGTDIISYQDELKPDSATILWRAPLKGSGDVDTDVSYDIWLVSDPNQIDSRPSNTLIASSVKMNQDNYVMSSTKLLGYKYVVTGLMPNSTYYFIIVAKKTYVDFVDNQLQNIDKESSPAMKVIITPAGGPFDQPVVPDRPPFRIKKASDGVNDMVSETSVVIQLQNKWYEEYIVPQGGSGSWVYRTPSQLVADSGDADIVSKIENGTLDTAESLKYRKVEYDDGVTIDVGCIKYENGMDYGNLDTIPADKITGVPAIPNDPSEITTGPDAIPDGLKHNIDITVDGLDPNGTYIIWLRAERRSVDLVSGPSDPIIVTTMPKIGGTLEKPTVPVFNYYRPSDNYIDLGWNFNYTYTYQIKYGTIDDVNSASGSATVTPDDLQSNSYYRVSGLTTDTVYYFFIQAQSSDASGNTVSSEWSDSLVVSTLPEIPPATPRGFGIKSGGVAKDSITYEWITSDGLQYILEVADNADFNNSTEYNANTNPEYTVSGLKSNFRYYARLYAYDSAKDLRSEPTQTIIVRTERSNDDYDSDVNTGNVISGDFITKDAEPVNHIWNINITGVNADRLIQYVKTDNKLDYTVDLQNAPDGTDRILLTVAGRVFDSMSQLGENLLIESDRNTLVIRPDMLPERQADTRLALSGCDVALGIDIISNADGSDTTNLNLKTPVTGVDVTFLEGGQSGQVLELNKPLKVVYGYTSPDWYNAGVTSGYILPGNSTVWQKAETTGMYNPDSGTGTLSFETLSTGRMAVGEPGELYYDDISNSWARKAIVDVASAHKLNAVTGRKFQPDKYVTNSDAAKFALDMLDYNYGSDYMNYAVKSGLLSADNAEKPDGICTRENAVAMAVRIYEIKTSEKAAATEDDTGIYKDIGQVSPSLLPRIRFAVENGIITSRFSDTFGPKDPITRAELMTLLEKVLKLAGEV